MLFFFKNIVNRWNLLLTYFLLFHKTMRIRTRFGVLKNAVKLLKNFIKKFICI